MKKVLIIPHHPALPDLKIRLIEIAKVLSQRYAVYVLNWRAVQARHLLSARISSALRDLFTKNKIYKSGALHIMEFPLLRRPFGLAFKFNSFWLERAIEKEKIDVVINGSYYMFSIPEKRDFKYIFDIADLPVEDIKTSPGRLIDRQIRREIKKADVVTVSSRGLQDYAYKNYQKEASFISNGADINKIRSINGQEMNKVRQKYNLTGKWVIGYIGKVGAWMNMELLVQAFREIKKDIPHAVLFIVGSCPDTVRRRFSTQDIIFTNGIPSEEIDAYFSVIDLGVLPGKKYLFQDLAFHLKVIEYTAARKLVVTTPLKETALLNFPNCIFAEEEKEAWVAAIKKAREMRWLEGWDGLADDYDWSKVGRKVYQPSLRAKVPEYIHCPICKSNAYQRVNTCKISREDADIPQETLDMVRCSGCGLIFVNPQPHFFKEEMKKLYDREYFNKGYMRFYGEEKEDRVVQSNEPFSYRLDLIERYKKPGRILDIGCATGGFLNLAKERGWETFGVEISDYAADLAIQKHHLNVFKGLLEEAHFKEGYFDIICASDIVEHVNDPRGFIGEVRRVLADDGLLYLAFPNAESFYYKFFGLISRYNYKNYFLLPHHLWHFSPGTIRLLLNKTGFDVLQLKFSHSRHPSLLMNVFNFRDRILLLAKKKALG